MIYTLRYKDKTVKELHFESKDESSARKDANSYCRREGFLFIRLIPFLTEITEPTSEKSKVA